MKQAAVAMIAALTLAGCADTPGDGTPSKGSAPTPHRSVPALESRPRAGVEDELTDALVEYVPRLRERDVMISDALLTETSAFVHLEISWGKGTERAVASLLREKHSGKWETDSYFEGTSSAPLEQPDRGSGGTTLLHLPAGRDEAMMGYVDPTLSLVEAVSPDGRLLSRDRPRPSGEFIVLVEPWSAIYLFRETSFSGMSILAGPEVPEPAVPADDEAIDVAVEFVNAAMTSSDAAENRLARGAPTAILDHFAPLLSSWTPESVDDSSVSGAEVHLQLRRDGTRAEVGLSMVQESEGWKIASFAYDAEVSS